MSLQISSSWSGMWRQLLAGDDERRLAGVPERCCRAVLVQMARWPATTGQRQAEVREWVQAAIYEDQLTSMLDHASTRPVLRRHFPSVIDESDLRSGPAMQTGGGPGRTASCGDVAHVLLWPTVEMASRRSSPRRSRVLEQLSCRTTKASAS